MKSSKSFRAGSRRSHCHIWSSVAIWMDASPTVISYSAEHFLSARHFCWPTWSVLIAQFPTSITFYGKENKPFHMHHTSLFAHLIVYPLTLWCTHAMRLSSSRPTAKECARGAREKLSAFLISYIMLYIAAERCSTFTKLFRLSVVGDAIENYQLEQKKLQPKSANYAINMYEFGGSQAKHMQCECVVCTSCPMLSNWNAHRIFAIFVFVC